MLTNTTTVDCPLLSVEVIVLVNSTVPDIAIVVLIGVGGIPVGTLIRINALGSPLISVDKIVLVKPTDPEVATAVLSGMLTLGIFTTTMLVGPLLPSVVTIVLVKRNEPEVVVLVLRILESVTVEGSTETMLVG
jgi:hypothetical protein